MDRRNRPPPQVVLNINAEQGGLIPAYDAEFELNGKDCQSGLARDRTVAIPSKRRSVDQHNASTKPGTP